MSIIIECLRPYQHGRSYIQCAWRFWGGEQRFQRNSARRLLGALLLASTRSRSHDKSFHSLQSPAFRLTRDPKRLALRIGRIREPASSAVHPDAICTSRCTLATAGRLAGPCWTSMASRQPFLRDGLPLAGASGRDGSGSQRPPGLRVPRDRVFEMLFDCFDSSSKRTGSSRRTGTSRCPGTLSQDARDA